MGDGEQGRNGHGTGTREADPDGRRLAAVRDSGLLEAPADPSLLRLNRLAVQLLGVPVSLVSVVDEDRQVFASAVGVRQPWAKLGETPLSHSFCKHVVDADAPLVVSDARADARVAENLAIRDLDVVAYAGVPLRLPDGATLGSFCAIDETPRTWTERDVVVLEDLAMLAADAIELRQSRSGAPLRDALTGLPGRTLFAALVEQALDQPAGGRAAAVLAVDLRGFRLVNDAFGHAAGDRLLVAVGDRLAEALGRRSPLCRSDADRFLALVPEASGQAHVAAVAARLREAVADAPFSVDGERVAMTARVGAAVAEPGSDADELIRLAVTALADDDDPGEGVGVAGPGARAGEASRVQATRRLQLRTALAGAHDRGEMWLAYQPIHDLAGGGIAGVEALIRWEHPVQGRVSPCDFIPAAESSGAIVPLGEWIVEQACADLAAWRRAQPGARLTVAVNVAPVQLRVVGFADVVAGALGRAGLPPSALTVEVTERTLLDDRPIHRETLETLRELGVAVALDDFGSGWSGLGFLTRFPIDVLKLDRIFCAELGREQRATALLNGIVALADGLGLRTVAEGIEEDHQLAIVRDLGCHLGQGWLLGRPLPADELAALL